MQYTKQAITELAKEKGVSELDMISELQSACAVLGDEDSLEKLCDIKWEIIKETI